MNDPKCSADHNELVPMLIGGAFVESVSHESIPVTNPADKTTICSVPRANRNDVDAAVLAASEAFNAWSRMPPRERGKILMSIADAIDAEAEALAVTLARETGNALRTQARPEIKTSAEVFRYFGGIAGELKGETVPIDDRMLNFTVRQPIGVVGAIIPWNAPVVLASVKIAPALCAGNTMVLKTAEDAPLAVLRLAAICRRYLPAGVLNVLTGYGYECGEMLANHPGISKLSFTGSTGVGRIVMHAAAERVIPVSLELGGKSPSIVFPDADQDWVADGVIAAARITRQSQSCTAGSRIFIHESIYDSFIAKLANKLTNIRIGNPLDESTDMGSLINEKQFNRVTGYIDEGLRMPGVDLAAGGLPPSEGVLSEGFYTIPTLFSKVKNDWRIAQEEIFGPVLCAIPWTDYADVIRQANATHYGLAGYVWTSDIAAALNTANAIDAGFIQINQGLGQFPGQAYGGQKQSGIGREYSLEGMLESFTTRKNVAISLANRNRA